MKYINLIYTMILKFTFSNLFNSNTYAKKIFPINYADSDTK